MRPLFTALYYLLTVIASALALWHLGRDGHPVWFGVLLTSLPPLLQRIRPYDRTPPIHHKVRLPLVSLLVMVGAGWVLLVVPERGSALWFTLSCLGGFLLNTYWAEAELTGPGSV